MSFSEFLSLFTLTLPVPDPFTGMRLPVTISLSSWFAAELLVRLVAQPAASVATIAVAGKTL